MSIVAVRQDLSFQGGGMEGVEGCLREPGQTVCRRHIRGFLEPCLLLLLHLNDSYGYDLTAALGSFGLGNVDSSLVYRMLRDLETAGLVGSKWQPASSMGPARRVYWLTEAGEFHLDDWISDLRITDKALHYFLQVYDCHMLTGEVTLLSCGEKANNTSLKTGGSSEMKRVAVSSNGYDLDALTSPVFGRCGTYVFVDLDTMEFEAVDNPAANAGGGAGIQAAQFVVEKGAQAVLTGNVGPNAFEVFRSANFPVYVVEENMTVRQAVERFIAGELASAATANVKAHAGMRRARTTKPAVSSPTVPDAQEQELSELKKISMDLRRQLADVITRIDNLEETQ